MKKIIFLAPFAAAALLLSGCASTGSSISVSDYQQIAASSSSLEVHRIHDVLPKYQRLAGESWPAIPFHGRIKPGQKNSDIPMIRQRLVQLGDLSSAADSHVMQYQQNIVAAVMHFQARHGLKADGVIGAGTLNALNVSPRVRLHELVDSMKQWASLPSGMNQQYIVVNIPSYTLNVIQDDQNILSMPVVIGDPKTPTPELQSRLVSLEVNPTWNVPRSIVEGELVHKMLSDKEYLSKKNIRILESWEKGAKEIDPRSINWHEYAGEKDLPYRLQQTAGEHNVLGEVKFLFPNEHSVYLHDTNNRGVFGLTDRALSHGCVRLGKPWALFDFVMQQNADLDLQDLLADFHSGKTKQIALKNRIPLYIVYITAWVDKNGQVQFRRDIYQKFNSAQ